MILLDRRFGLATVEIEHYFHERAELALELAANLRATDGDLYQIRSTVLTQQVQHEQV